MTKPPGDLLTRPARTAAALVGLALLDEARVGCGRLAAPDDAEALHDFRVALRRLRSVLRSFRSELGDAVSRKLQRRLRDVTRATGAAREGEPRPPFVPIVRRPRVSGAPAEPTPLAERARDSA